MLARLLPSMTEQRLQEKKYIRDRIHLLACRDDALLFQRFQEQAWKQYQKLVKMGRL